MTGTLSAALGLLFGYLGPWAWPFELFANFRVQYAALFALCMLLLLGVRRFKWALAAAFGAAFCVVSVIAYTGWPWPAALQREADAFRLVTFNVWFRNQDLARTARYLERSGADAVILLELERSRALRLQALLPSYPYAHIDDQIHGAVIFSRWPLRDAQFEPLCGLCTRIARARLEWRGRQITLLGVHLHWPLGAEVASLRRTELRALAKLVRAQQGATLVGGDFNLTPWSRYFTEFVAQSGLSDCAHGQGWSPTWPMWPAALLIRIDQCFASSDWQTTDITIGPRLGSDHLPNVVDLRLAR